MSETVKTMWLKDKDQNKIAPKTLSSQILNADGTLFEQTIQTQINENKAYVDSKLECLGEVESNFIATITVENDVNKSDKTYAEIKAAVDGGKTVFYNFRGKYFLNNIYTVSNSLGLETETKYGFEAVLPFEEDGEKIYSALRITINSDDTITAEMYAINYQLAEDSTLTTESKTVVGAINELASQLNTNVAEVAALVGGDD